MGRIRNFFSNGGFFRRGGQGAGLFGGFFRNGGFFRRGGQGAGLFGGFFRNGGFFRRGGQGAGPFGGFFRNGGFFRRGAPLMAAGGLAMGGWGGGQQPPNDPRLLGPQAGITQQQGPTMQGPVQANF